MSPSDAPKSHSTKPKKQGRKLTTAPQPRPALSRAPDADVHPVTGGSVSLPRPTSGKGFKPAKGGPTTADALMGAAGDKLVDLGVRVPKSVRKKLRQQAKARDMSVDDLVASILTAALPRD